MDTQARSEIIETIAADVETTAAPTQLTPNDLDLIGGGNMMLLF